MSNRTLNELLTFIEQHANLQIMQQLGSLSEQVELNQMTQDSRDVSSGDVFIALQGEQVHGLRFLADVLQQGAAVIIADRPLRASEKALLEQAGQDVMVLALQNIQTMQGDLAAWFYSYPSQSLKVIGITGTNGKTSCAFYCAQLLHAQQQKVAIIGTLGNGVFNGEMVLHSLQKTRNTTPNAVALQQLLAEFVAQDIKWCVMEVSSHAICLGRIQGVQFCATALTQVTRDHMDFHPTLEHYQQTKMQLFRDYHSDAKIINSEDEIGRELLVELLDLQKDDQQDQWSVWAYGEHCLTSDLPDSWLENMHLCSYQLLALNEQGMQARFSTRKSIDGSALRGNIPLIGRFNIENVSCSLAILLSQGFALEDLLASCGQLQAVMGRMQIVSQQPSVILDFAHTPDALQQVLIASRHHLAKAAKLWVVFGCGGDRDRGKRPLMAEVAAEYADKIMVTSDNPRSEEPQLIIDEIMTGFDAAKKTSIMQQVDRTQAIHQVLSQAAEHDLVVIAGKGHEDYQEINGVRQPYSDFDAVQQWLQSKR